MDRGVEQRSSGCNQGAEIVEVMLYIKHNVDREDALNPPLCRHFLDFEFLRRRNVLFPEYI